MLKKNCSESKGPSFDMKKKGLPSTWVQMGARDFKNTFLYYQYFVVIYRSKNIAPDDLVYEGSA